jgi:hypothetical protein
MNTRLDVTSRATLEDEAHQAIQRVGRTAEAQAQWLIDVGYRYQYVYGVDSPQPAEMRALRWEMAAFCAVSPNSKGRGLVPFSRDAVLRWLVRIHKGIQQLAAGQAWGHRLVTHYNFWVPLVGQRAGYRVRIISTAGYRVPIIPTPGYREPKESNALHVTWTQKDCMAHRICEVLAAVGDRLRRCQRQECGRLFVRQKRQLYCTPACASVVRTRKHRAKQRSIEKV